jgi:WD40 repeat protein/serine/threonine protein kinase
MTAPQSKAKSIFLNALEITSPAERQAYIAAQCGDDEALRREVEEFLQHHDRLGSFLEAPGPASSATIDLPANTERPGSRIGPYKLLQQIGEGGMGAVFMAEQIEPVQRKVALKLIKAGMDSQQVIARFEAERQALALMDHPNIARVLDANTTESGRPYFVMELVKGVPITAYCDEHHLTPKERLELFIPVCQAVQHAHQKGIIHRDLKPSNVLIALYDGKPVPKVIDFGVAKATGPRLTEKTLFTEFGAVVGTLEYMSPEQAELNQLDIDTRSDIYSLGVLLYELLTGTTPLERKRLNKSALLEALRLIREEEPPRPSTRLSTAEGLPAIAANRGLEPKKLSGLVRGELDWIAMKALEKDRSRRYETANGLALDVQRYLADEPVQACPPSTRYRLRKFARKHRTKVWTAAAFVILLVAAVATSTWKWGEALVAQEGTDKALEEVTRSQKATQEALGEVNKQKRTAEERLVRMHVETGIKLIDDGDLFGALPWLVKALEAEQGGPEREEVHRLRLSAVLAECPRLVQLWGHHSEVGYAEFSPDGTRVVTACEDGTARIWDVATGLAVTPPLKPTSGRARSTLPMFLGYERTIHATFSPDGRRIAVSSALPIQRPAARVWDAATFKPMTPPLEHTTWPLQSSTYTTFSPDGRRLLTILGSTARVWDAATGQPITPLLEHSHAISHAAFSLDGRRVVTSGADGARLWDARSGQPAKPLLQRNTMDTEQVRQACFSPDGHRIVTVDGIVARVLDAATGLPVTPPLGHGVHQAAFSPNGQRILTASWHRTAELWDSTTGKQLTVFKHNNSVHHAAFSSDGERVLTASADHTARVWDAITGLPLTPPLRHGAAVQHACFSPDGNRIVTTSSDQTARVWDIASRRPITWQLKFRADHMALSPDGRRMVCSGWEQPNVHVLDCGTGRAVAPPLNHGGVTSTAFSPRGHRLVTCSPNDVFLWDAQTFKAPTRLLKQTSLINWAVFSPDGNRLVTASDSDTDDVRLWDAGSGQPLTSPVSPSSKPLELLPCARFPSFQPVFSPDGRRIIRPSGTGVRMWDGATGAPVEAKPLKHSKRVASVWFSPDGRHLLTTNLYDATAQVWDSLTGLAVGPPLRPVETAAFSPDGHWLVTASSETALVWDAFTGTLVHPPLKHAREVRYVAFSRDGRRILTASIGPAARVWDAATGLPISPALKHTLKDEGWHLQPAHFKGGFTADGNRIVLLNGTTVRVWDLRAERSSVTDLISLSQVMGGLRMDPRGAMRPLDAEALGETWQKVRPNFPR